MPTSTPAGRAVSESADSSRRWERRPAAFSVWGSSWRTSRSSSRQALPLFLSPAARSRPTESRARIAACYPACSWRWSRSSTGSSTASSIEVVACSARSLRGRGYRDRRLEQSPERWTRLMKKIEKVGVLGGGLMGSGIAQVSAAAGFPTTVREVSDALCTKSRQSIEKTLAKGIERGKVTEAERDATLGNLRFVTDLKELADSDLFIEAVVEDLEVKNSLWSELDKIARPDAIFASNTSSLTIIAMAAESGRPDKMLGLHFFNPVPLMKLVEVVRTITTSEETEKRAVEFVRALGKEPIRAKDSSGFVVNLLLIPYMLDAINALESGVASVEDIDKGMQLGAGHPMGPFTLLDFVGLDTAYKIAEIMFAEYREKRYAPPPLLKRMVLAGWHGKKAGKGFYDYSTTPPRVSSLGL